MKTVMAVSRAEYRGVLIWETAKGCSIIISDKQYDFLSLQEATAFIDASYARVIQAN